MSTKTAPKLRSAKATSRERHSVDENFEKVKTKPKVVKETIHRLKAGSKITGADTRLPSVEQIKSLAMQLRNSQLTRLMKDLDRVVEERWQLEREAAAKRIAAKGITDADIDEYIVRRRRENRR